MRRMSEVVAGLALLCVVANSQVLINEVHGLGAGATPALPGDYVELWNQSATPYDLTGHTLSIWSGDVGALSSVVIPCTPSATHIIPGNCFWVIQEGGTLGGALTGTLTGLNGMTGLPGTFSSSTSMGIRLTDAMGNCVAYAYLRRLGTTLPVTPPNLTGMCTWTLGDIGASGTGLAHVQRLTNANTNSFADWGHDATTNAGTPGAPNTTGSATQTSLGACVFANQGLGYQINSPECTLDSGSLVSTGGAPITVTATACDPAQSFNLRSTLVGQPYDLGLSQLPLLVRAGSCGAMGTPAFQSIGGQVVNLDLADPALFFLNGLTLNTNFPGDFSLTLISGLAIPTTFGQMHILDPAHPDGARVSSPARVEIASGTTTTLTHGDDSNVVVTLSSFCGAPMGGVSFYGTSYTQVSVISNGRLMFGGSDTDLSPTVADALADVPFIGLWTDWNPAAAGSGRVTASTNGGLVTFRWNSVFYYATTVPATWQIVFDPATGSWSIEGLTGVPSNPAGLGGGDAQFLGLSPGVAAVATNPGLTSFMPGASNTPLAATDMIYDFWDGLVASAPNGMNRLASLQTGLNSLHFVPTMGTYQWSGF